MIGEAILDHTRLRVERPTGCWVNSLKAPSPNPRQGLEGKRDYRPRRVESAQTVTILEWNLEDVREREALQETETEPI